MLAHEQGIALEPRPRLYGHAGLRNLRARLARAFLLKIKRATHRAPPRLIGPNASRVLVIAPHMDDEVIGCGGTLLILREGGAELHVAFVSDSSAAKSDPELASSISAVRRAEARRVGAALGFTSINELGFPDGKLARHEGKIAGELAALVESLKPDLLFCPFPAEEHSDHMSCASAAAAAARAAKFQGAVFAYEVCTPLWPNVAVDITSVAQRKEEAIRLYESQISYFDYASAALGLNRFRGLGVGVAFAEAFFACKPDEFAEVTALLDRL